MVRKIGVSIYEPEELDASLPACSSTWSRRRSTSWIDDSPPRAGWRGLREAGTEVHVRSVFLQGLLLMGAALRPARFDRWQPLWQQWDRWLGEHALTPVQACLSFVLSQTGVDRVVVGVDSGQQLQEIIAGAAKSPVAPPANLTSEDLDLINPSRWSAS